MRKQLGQHFIRSDRVARAVCSAAPITTDYVLEIGPGRGILTAQLLADGHRVIGIEKDRALVAVLKERFADAVSDGTFVLCGGDVRDGDWMSPLNGAAYSVVANIPYYLTGSLIRNLLTASHQPTAVILVVQKEVAERVVAQNDKESLLSLSVKLFGTPHYIKTLPRRLFSPQPKVNSAILTITDIHTLPQGVQDVFFDIIHTAFHQKRRTVLKKFADNPAVYRTLLSCGVRENDRAEDIPFATWLTVAERAAG